MKKLICFCFVLFCLVGVLFAENPLLPCGLEYGMTVEEVQGAMKKAGFTLNSKGVWESDYASIDYEATCKLLTTLYNDDGVLYSVVCRVFNDSKNRGLVFLANFAGANKKTDYSKFEEYSSDNYFYCSFTNTTMTPMPKMILLPAGVEMGIKADSLRAWLSAFGFVADNDNYFYNSLGLVLDLADIPNVDMYSCTSISVLYDDDGKVNTVFCNLPKNKTNAVVVDYYLRYFSDERLKIKATLNDSDGVYMLMFFKE